MYERYLCTNYLEHYGVKGMRWGVRKQDPIGKYKNKQRKKIEKTYAKATANAKKLLEMYPDDKSLQNEVKSLKSLYKKDMKRIDDMTYHDVMKAKREESAVAKEKRDKVIQSVQRNALWAGKMGLLGVRAYGTFKAVEILGTTGGLAITYLRSDAGQDLINSVVKKASSYVNVGDSFVKTFTGMDVSANAIFGGADTATRVENVDKAVRYVGEDLKRRAQ